MTLITKHQYLDRYPIDPTAERLILGTIHPHHHEKFLMPFFYGNELSIWKIFHAAFPEELSEPSDVGSVLAFLKKRKLTVSDTIISCERMNPTALDEDLKPILFNKTGLMESIKRSAITEILCTSGFGRNNAFGIFYRDILGLPLTKVIRTTREADLPISIFGRPVKVKALYSPARTAMMGIGRSRSYKAVKEQYAHLSKPVEAFRIDLYKQAVS